MWGGVKCIFHIYRTCVQRLYRGCALFFDLNLYSKHYIVEKSILKKHYRSITKPRFFGIWSSQERVFYDSQSGSVICAHGLILWSHQNHAQNDPTDAGRWIQPRSALMRAARVRAGVVSAFFVFTAGYCWTVGQTLAPDVRSTEPCAPQVRPLDRWVRVDFPVRTWEFTYKGSYAEKNVRVQNSLLTFSWHVDPNSAEFWQNGISFGEY